MNILFISPRLAVQKGDILGSGVPYWPYELVSLATKSASCGDHVIVRDLFSESITSFEDCGDHFLQGLSINKTNLSFGQLDIDLIIVFAISFMSHRECINIIRSVSLFFPKSQVAVLENSQAVTGYHLQVLLEEFKTAGASIYLKRDIITKWRSGLTVNSLISKYSILNSLQNKPIFEVPTSLYTFEEIPYPDWGLINYRAYWRLPYSHGPKSGKYLPIQTSRGCPYPCDFCVVPQTNDRKWTGVEPASLVSLLELLSTKYNVINFHIEDLNPTIGNERWKSICKGIVAKNLNVSLYIVSGTKAESLSSSDIELMHKAGVRYISISPESGDTRLTDQIGKRVSLTHVIMLVSKCSSLGIRTQACFLIGHPSEYKETFAKTKSILMKLLNAGLSEPAFFVVAPLPGSKIYRNGSIKVSDSCRLPSFSPTGRENYSIYSSQRRNLIIVYALFILLHPTMALSAFFRILVNDQQLKVENVPRRILFILWHAHFKPMIKKCVIKAP